MPVKMKKKEHYIEIFYFFSSHIAYQPAQKQKWIFASKSLLLSSSYFYFFIFMQKCAKVFFRVPYCKRVAKKGRKKKDVNSLEEFRFRILLYYFGKRFFLSKNIFLLRNKYERCFFLVTSFPLDVKGGKKMEYAIKEYFFDFCVFSVFTIGYAQFSS